MVSQRVVRANLALALPHLSDKERLTIEKNHTIYVWYVYGNDQNDDHIVKRNEQKICNHKYRVDKEYEQKKKVSCF
jgi:lauroyl/myristoyl acyltransferase